MGGHLRKRRGGLSKDFGEGRAPESERQTAKVVGAEL